jgi:aspartyl-tRNA(Asn)/glutamyl-tRNA(Gln) amidotransferase subunit A
MEDAVEALLPMMGHDPRDQTTSTLPVPDLKSVLRGSIEGMVVGIPREYRHPSLSPEIRGWWDQSVDWLKAEGAQIREVSLPHTEAALPTYYVIAPAEASSNLARYDGVRFGHRTPLDDLPFEAWITRNRSEGFGEEVRRRILVGTYVLSSQCYDHYFAQAQRVRGLICQDFEAAFREVDVLLTPTTPTEAFALDAVLDPLSMYINDLFTIPASLAGLPALSVPVGLSDRGLPLGMQCIARPWHEADMVRVACALERAAGFVCHPAHREGSRES